MKQIGLLGGTSWPSTMEYYRLLNSLVAERLGGFHSARILLSSIDYHEIKSGYEEWRNVPRLLKNELKNLLILKPECLVICNNTLHKALDEIAPEINLQIPVFHAIDLAVQQCKKAELKKILLLATQRTMEDPYFSEKFIRAGVEVLIPTPSERAEVQAAQDELAAGKVTAGHVAMFSALTKRYALLDGVILACTELPLALREETSALPIVNTLELQCKAAIDWALA